VVRGQVRSVTDFGVFVGLQEGIDGLVHVSDLSWTQRIKRPGDLYKKGDEVEAVVLAIDAPNERFALGIKQLKPDPWTELLTTHPVGSLLTGKVVRIVDFGAFVEIEPGVEGLVHVSQLREERVENPRDVVKEGDELTVKVIDLDPDAKKVSLSVKAAQHEEFDYREHMRALESEGRASFGDILAGKLGRKE
jgi:small subunit ribosomal protein S1